MRFSLVIVFIVQLILQSSIINAQQKSFNTDSIFGLSPLLYNGKIYSTTQTRYITGDPYFKAGEFVEGHITISGKCYEDLFLNYDIYNQQLLLKFSNVVGASLIIEISKSWLEAFRMGQVDFEYKPDPEGLPRIRQVIRSDAVEVNYFWRKEILLDHVFGAASYSFSKPKKQQFVIVNRLYTSYKNNREFIHAFPPGKQKQLSVFLRANKIKVRKATDENMHKVVDYSNSILTK